MPITITATATANQALIGLLSDVGGALSEIADIKNIELPNRATTTQLSNLSDNLNIIDAEFTTVANRVDDIEFNKMVDLYDKYGTLDEKLIAEVDKIDNVAEDVADIKPKTNRIFNWLGNALDAVDVIGFVVDLIATSALATAIANVGSQSLDRDNALNTAIHDLYDLLNQVSNMNEIQFNQLVDLLNQANQGIGTGNNINSQNATQINYISDNVLDLQTSLSSGLTTINFIKTDTETILETQTQTQTQISNGFGGIPIQICEALQNPLCNPCSDGIAQGTNLSGVNSKLDQILQELGFPFSCGTSAIYNSVGEALSALVCGSGTGIDFNEALEDYFSNNDPVDLQPVLDKIETKGNEVIEEIRNIPEPTLYVPDEWAIKLEGDRPQLIAGMQDAKMAGKGSASKWAIVIPRPRPDIQSFTWEQLIEYFPDYKRGSHGAIATLKDNSVMRVRAKSKALATEYLARMMELVDPRYATSIDDFVYHENKRFKQVKVTCRGIGYYETGRKEGEKPTKRWYYPAQD